MGHLKAFVLLIPLLAANYAFSQDGQRAYYEKAAKAYRNAAAQTKCPDTRGRVLIQYAEWNERMAKTLAGTLSSAGPQPSTPIPPCDGDLVGGGGGSAAGSSTSRPAGLSTSAATAGGDQSAVSAAMTGAYQDALNSGRKESGAVLQGFLAAAQSTSDAKLSNTYVGAGLLLGGIMALSEGKAEKQAAEEEAERRLEEERERLAAITRAITAKNDFITTFESSFFKSGFQAASRKAILLAYPSVVSADQQDFYISDVIHIKPYADNSFPLKETVSKNIMSGVPEGLSKKGGLSFLLLYPVMEPVDFTATLRKISAACSNVNFSPQMFPVNYGAAKPSSTTNTDFWGNGAKPKATPVDSSRAKNDFWNN